MPYQPPQEPHPHSHPHSHPHTTIVMEKEQFRLAFIQACTWKCLTPTPKEMDRMMGLWQSGDDVHEAVVDLRCWREKQKRGLGRVVEREEGEGV